MFSRYLTIILAYFLTWQFARVANVAPDVSAFYPAAGTLVFFIHRWGARYLPAAVLAMLAANLPQMPFWDWGLSNWLHLLRQLLVYGGLAVLARERLWLTFPLVTLPATIRLLVFSLLASLLSAVIAVPIFWYCSPAVRELIGIIFLGFWVGDFSGIIMFLGATSLVLTLGRRIRAHRDGAPFRAALPVMAGLVASTVAVVVVMAFLAFRGELHGYSYLILMPVIIGTITYGLNFGMAAAFFANLAAVMTYILFGGDQMPPVQLQLLCAEVMCVGMLLGGAIDDRLSARFDSWHDPLTGLLNRRAFFEQGEQMLERARRYHQSLTVIMIDLDHFKQVNDTYGHDWGDRLLCQVAEKCKAVTRTGDLCARVGGEEFVILIEHANRDQAAQITERLRQMIQQLNRGTSTDPASASMGVSLYAGDNANLGALVQSADRALYVAKETGRNRVVFDSSAPADSAPIHVESKG